MREQILETGVKRWHGTDFVDLQSEPLTAIQKMLEPFGNCIINGVTFTNNPWTMQECYIGCMHADGYKIVKVPQIVFGNNQPPPFYLYVVKTVENKLYDNGQTKASVNVYTGAYTLTQPATGFFVKVNGLSGGIRFKDLMTPAIDAWHYVGTANQPQFVNGFANGSIISSANEEIRFRKDGINCIFSGTIDHTPLGNVQAINTEVDMFSLPVGFRPDLLRTISVRSNTPAGWASFLIKIYPTGVVSLTCTQMAAGMVVTDLQVFQGGTDWTEFVFALA